MAAKRHMDVKSDIAGHNIIIADITGYSLKSGTICIWLGGPGLSNTGRGIYLNPGGSYPGRCSRILRYYEDSGTLS